jgi:hypothetical protein
MRPGRHKEMSMSRDVQNEVQDRTRELLQGRLKHVRAAALAAALNPAARCSS